MSDDDSGILYTEPPRHRHGQNLYDNAANHQRGTIARCSCSRYVTPKRYLFLDEKQWSPVYWWNLKAKRNIRALRKPA